MKWEGLIDTHAHLDYDSFARDLHDVLARAKEVGLAGIITIGTNIESCRETVKLVQEYGDYLWGAVGIHPHEAIKVTGDTIREIKTMIKEERIVALGEMGLDYHYNHSPQDVQGRVLCTQLRLAHSFKKPIIIHSRQAEKDTMRILKEERAEELAGVFHCFSGSKDMARQCLDLGFYLGLGGVLTFANAHSLREIAQYAPLEQIILETDCPYLAPVPKRGKRNEPAYVGYVAEKLGEIKSLSVEEIIARTSDNARKLFNL